MNRFIYLLIIILLQIVKTNAQNENTISNDEKIYGLSTIWKECSYNFAFFNRNPSLNWDSCYKNYIPQVLNTENDWTYYLVLQMFISNLFDGHTRVYPPVSLRESHFASTNHLISTRLIHNHVFIEDVFSDSLIKHGLVKGLEIVKIDDIDVLQYAQKVVAPYICASTKQDFIYQTYTVYLLNGELSNPVKITTKSKDGSVHEFALTRKKWLREITPYENIPLKYQLINDTTGYLKINHFGGGDGFQKLFDSIYTEIIKTKKLIIDIRQNSGGASDNAWYVLQHLIDTSFKVPGWKSPMFISAYKSWKFKEEWFYNKSFELTPIPDISIYNKPIFLLIDESTFSAAEDFCIIFKVANRGSLIGRKTAGSTGNSVLINLPSNGFARICAKHDYFEGIAEYEGLGIAPDMEVNYDIKNLQFEHDIILNTAIKSTYGQMIFESHTSKESLIREATQTIGQFDLFMRNNGIELPYKPGVRISTTYALIFWDSENKSVVLPFWHELYPEQIEIFNRWKGEEAQQFFNSLFNWFFIPHELGHFAMLTNSDLKISPYETERRANIFAISFLRNDEKNHVKLSYIEKSLNDVIKRLPPIDLQNMTEEEYFNANYQKLGNNPDSYAFFQFKFILDILKDKNRIPLIDLIKRDNISENILVRQN